ncbi:MAG: hypothetical protein IPJ65_29685 [Archangiaceae bacterium]|nr:hypothetical protein [Archangiaceae bacterium]
MRCALVPVLIAASACVPPELSVEGLACDEAHACPGGLQCCGQRCVRPDGGYGWPAPAAHQTWRQAAEGFDAVRAPAGAVVTVGACNAVSARTDSSAVGPAVAVVSRAALLPAGGEGRLTGRFTIKGPVDFKGNTGFLVLTDRAGTRFLLSTALNPQGALAYYSAPDLLHAGEVFGNGDTEVTVDTPHALEVRWKQSGFVELTLDGRRTLYAPLDGGPTFDRSQAVPSELRVGINHYNTAGGAVAGWSVELSDFELWDVAGD